MSTTPLPLMPLQSHSSSAFSSAVPLTTRMSVWATDGIDEQMRAWPA